MELEGLKRCLNKVEEDGIVITDLVTDRHSQVKAFMKKERSDVNHWFDVWHVAKGIYIYIHKHVIMVKRCKAWKIICIQFLKNMK